LSKFPHNLLVRLQNKTARRKRNVPESLIPWHPKENLDEFHKGNHTKPCTATATNNADKERERERE